MMKNVLVMGGAGYVGSHTCKALSNAGYTPIAYDNLSNGHDWAVQWGPLVHGDILDKDHLHATFETYRPVGVLHFAALIEVGISVKNPDLFWETNVQGALNVIRACHHFGNIPFVLSSTCAIFGETDHALSEDHPHNPISPYAKTKHTVEEILMDMDQAYELRSSALRYFNAAGASSDGEIGEAHSPETHLIPLACQAALGQRDEMILFGDDYDTPDGTCIRDYVHVDDLAQAHVLALARLLKGDVSRNFNLGTGHGHSVKQVLDATRQISGTEFPIRLAERRPGDCRRLVGDNKRAVEELGWSPQYPEIEGIIQTAWDWHTKQKT